MTKETAKPFPEQGKFPSGDEFCAYVRRSIEELDTSAYVIGKRIPGNRNHNIVREIERGTKSNPTAKTMKQIFDAIEGLRREAAAIEAVSESEA